MKSTKVNIINKVNRSKQILGYTCVDSLTTKAGDRLTRWSAEVLPRLPPIRFRHITKAWCPTSYFGGATAVSGTAPSAAISSSYETIAKSSGTRSRRSWQALTN